MAKSTQRKSGGDKKHGRNATKCQVYRVYDVREKNKERKNKKVLHEQEKKALKKAKRG
jgi:hypothetical protein